jgi:hypothetical protein
MEIEWKGIEEGLILNKSEITKKSECDEQKSHNNENPCAQGCTQGKHIGTLMRC